MRSSNKRYYNPFKIEKVGEFIYFLKSKFLDQQEKKEEKYKRSYSYIHIAIKLLTLFQLLFLETLFAFFLACC